MPLSSTRWLVCALLLLATTLNYLDRIALNQLVKPMRSAFGFDEIGYSRLESGFQIAFGLGTLFFGWLVDRVNVRWVYPVVVFGWSLAGLLTGFADLFSVLMICRVALGLFEAGNWPCGIRTTRQVLPPEERSFGNALFQSGTAIGAILAPLIILLCLDVSGPGPDVWRYPFLIIGCLGLLWVAAWLLLTPGPLFPPPLRSAEPQTPFSHVFRDTRFWLLIALIIGVNTTWHTVRIWMPYLLQDTHKLDDRQFQYFAAGYYFCADIGSWTIGLGTLFLARRGHDLFRTRRGLYIVCTVLLVLAAGLLPRVDSTLMLCVVMGVLGFAALGLFPTYFALSQDLSARHQGKITGTLGFINALYLAGLYQVEAPYAKATHDYAGVVAISTVPAVLACGLLFLWKSPQSSA